MGLFSNLMALRVFQIACLVIVYVNMSRSVKGMAELGRLNFTQSSCDGVIQRPVVRRVRVLTYSHAGCTIGHVKKRCVAVSWWVWQKVHNVGPSGCGVCNFVESRSVFHTAR